MQVREVEGLVHLVRANPLRQPGERIHVGFGAEDAVRSVLFQDGTPAAVDVVQGGLAEHRRVMAGETVRAVAVCAATPVGQAGCFDQRVGDVHPEAGDAAVQPEAEDAFKLSVDSRVVPVEVRLRGVEEVQEPLAGLSVRLDDARPCRSAEMRLPVVGRLVAVVVLGRPGR